MAVNAAAWKWHMSLSLTFYWLSQREWCGECILATGRGLVRICVGRWEGGAENILSIIQFTLRILIVNIALNPDISTWPIHNVLGVS